MPYAAFGKRERKKMSDTATTNKDVLISALVVKEMVGRIQSIFQKAHQKGQLSTVLRNDLVGCVVDYAVIVDDECAPVVTARVDLQRVDFDNKKGRCQIPPLVRGQLENTEVTFDESTLAKMAAESLGVASENIKQIKPGLLGVAWENSAHAPHHDTEEYTERAENEGLYNDLEPAALAYA